MPLIVTDVAKVAALLRVRTRDNVGNETGAFSADTRPTLEQAQALLDEASSDVISAIGTDEPCTQELASDAAKVIHILAAMLIEVSYFPEQVATNRSPYDQLERLYESRLARLIKAVHDECGTGIGPPENASGGQLPQFGYGCAPLIGKRTRW